MKWDEFAFLNQQLASMLRDGIPLEGALRQLCRTMQRGDLRSEFEKLEADLSKGTPLGEALNARQLPPLYVQMIQVGVKSGDLPGVLTMLADYYQRSNLIWTRLKGLMVYPLIVLAAATALSVFLVTGFHHMARMFETDLLEGEPTNQKIAWISTAGVWLPLVVILLVVAGVVVVSLRPRMQQKLRWRFPGSREASLWRLAAAMNMMLENGCTLKETINFAAHLEQGAPVAEDLMNWQERLASGRGNFADLAVPSRVIPPLFIWLVAGAGSDLAAGFKRAAGIYRARADYQTELLLQAALPVAVILLGVLILTQMLMFFFGQLLPFVSLSQMMG